MGVGEGGGGGGGDGLEETEETLSAAVEDGGWGNLRDSYHAIESPFGTIEDGFEGP